MPHQTTKKATQRPKKGGTKRGVVLIPQPHGGALLSGGQKGQAPGPGRTPDHARRLALEIGITEAIPRLRRIINNLAADDAAVIAACREVLRVGVPQQKEVDLATDKVRVLAQQWRTAVVERAITDVCDAATADLLRTRIDELTLAQESA